MELKDVILQTLAEIDELAVAPAAARAGDPEIPAEPAAVEKTAADLSPQPCVSAVRDSGEELFLVQLRDRILVLFEGFQSPHIQNVESKIDLTLNFFEYLLASIDERLAHRDRTTDGPA